MKKYLLKFRRLITAILLIAVFSLAYLVFFDKNINIAEASWWNDSWNYRKSIQVSNNTTGETNVYISLTIDTSATSTIQSDCGDLRFTKATGKLLSYYLVSGCETATTTIHVNFETFEAGEQAIYYYYGNESAENGFSASDFTTEASDYTIGAVGSEEVGGGPIGYWSFNEGYGVITHDESSGGNDGTITGATWKDESDCVSGKCLYFDGVDETRVDTDIQDNMTEFTACAWFKANSLTNVDNDTRITLLSKLWSLDIDNNGQIRFWINTSSNYPRVNSTNNVSVNKWYQVCGVYYGVGVYPKLFLNGADVGSGISLGSGVQSDNSGNVLIIGANSSYIYNFNGYIDEVKIYPYARTADQIKQDYNAGLAGVSSQSGVSASFGGQSDKWMSDGLVGYWKMDESATTSGAIDSSGNGNNGTYEGTASTTAGKFGRGGVFDGGGGYVDLGDVNNVIGAITLAAWIKVDAFNISHQAILTKGDRSYRIQRDGNSNNIVFATGEYNNDLTQAISGVDVNDGRWHYVVGTFSGGNGGVQKIYIDGIESGSAVRRYSDWNYEAFSLMIGENDYNDASGWDGQIDEVRIYNRALSKTEVQKLYEWAPGPVLHLKMDEKNGTTTYDSSGYENNGAINGASWDRGKYGSALDFDGVDNNVNIGDLDVLDNAEAMTIATWIKDNNSSENRSFVAKYSNVTNQFSFQTSLVTRGDYDDIEFCMSWDACAYTNGNIHSSGAWEYWVAIFDGTLSSNDEKIKIYKNGIQQNLVVYGTIPTKAFDSTYPLRIGSRNFNSGTSGYFSGKIDDVRIYNYARTQKQILEDMYAGNPMRGAVLDLDFDEGRGGTVYDNSIFKNNGTLYPGTAGSNTATSAMWSLDGRDGGAIEFDGTDDYISIPDFGY